ncbi:MAG: N-acetylneuraminate synthase family protein [Phycisphaeraceae bacterium]|nr:N-acetylneuraminate synthase family protein [Phycisphaeraceae bacterium]
MNIASRTIGPGLPPYLIAEIGVNHDGSIDRALMLTEAAACAGADAIKLQLFRTDLLMGRAAKLAAYQHAAGDSDPLSMLRRLELDMDGMAAVVDRAHALGMHAIVTVFSAELVAEAERLPWDAYKSASPDAVNRPLLQAMADTGRPLIVSTGACDSLEVERAVEWLRGARDRLALLQCVSCYPTADADAAIDAMHALRRLFDGPVGYSDHTTGEDTGALAASLGACLLEKHLTYDRAARGPDHAASLDPGGFARYAEAARSHGTAAFAPDDPRINTAEKRVLACEADVRRVSRQSITARRALPAGHTLTPDDLTIKRPGTGLEPWRLDQVIGRRLARCVDADMPLLAHDLAPE